MPGSFSVAVLPRGLLWDEQLTRPTTSFARGCKLWSRERQFYEEERTKNMRQFKDRPYLYLQYPELARHYPGTWRVAQDSAELDDIVFRLTRPTRAHQARAQEIKERAQYVRFVVETAKSKDITYDQRKAQAQARRTPASAKSASARLEGNNDSSNNTTTTTTTTNSNSRNNNRLGSHTTTASSSSTLSVGSVGADVRSSTQESGGAADVPYRFRGSRKWDKTAWAHVRVRGASPRL